MKLSTYFLHTLKETPQDADIPSHILMMRSGMLLRLASGIYNYLPMALRVLKKIEKIVREEMDRFGGQELLMPAMNPAEIWQESGRWEAMGDNMFRFKDRTGHDFCLGMTHEEIITDIVRKRVKSYRQLPVLLYQIQTKFRDEPRPRGGVIRAREFIMKDAYSFHTSWEDLDKTYKDMYQAYSNIFTRCGMNFRVVQADSGPMGGDESHEFSVPAASGEDTVFVCPCGYGANREMTYFMPKPNPQPDTAALPEKVVTPESLTIEQLEKFLKRPARDFIKTLIYKVDGELMVVLIRGDRELNEVKLRKALKAKTVEMATPEEIEKATGGPLGFSGPVGLKGVKIIADNEVEDMRGAVTGANQFEEHLINVSYGRDFTADLITQLRVAESGDCCASCGKEMKMERCIEMGHIFKLGTKYTESLGATYLNENGQEHPIIMGCYGIGVSRIIASVLENSHDQDGIIWPLEIAPFQVEVIPVLGNEPRQMQLAEEIYQELQKEGVQVLLDDRDLRPGVKFKDADLIGIPLRLVIGEKALAEGEVEFKARQSGEKFMVKREQVKEEVKKILTGKVSEKTVA